MTNSMQRIVLVLLVVILALVIATAMFISPQKDVAYADGEAAQANSIVSDAINALFADSTGAVNIQSIMSGLFSSMGYANTAMTFLKLIGVMKDATQEALANISVQLTIINDKLNVMDGKLNSIINSMSEIKGKQDFIDRTTAARDYRTAFNNFKLNYKTNGLDALITEYKSKQTDAIKDWYNSSAASERAGAIDNSTVTLLYDLRDAGSENERYELRFTTENGVPAAFEGRYVTLSAAYLPTQSDVKSWNIDTYRSEVETYIKNNIKNNFAGVVKQNFDSLTVDNDDLIAQVAEEAVNVLVFRTTAVEINKNSLFANTVLQKFDNYSLALMSYENGFDAIVRAQYLTHAFEYEVTDTIKEIYQSIVFETAYYGSFVKDVLAMSNDIPQSEKNGFDQRFLGLLINLDKAKNNSLTGHPNYCYVTNTILYYGVTELTANAELKTYTLAGNDGYVSHSTRDVGSTIYRFDQQGRVVEYPEGSTTKYNKNYLIGDDSATLLGLTLKANGITADQNYLSNHLYGRTDRLYTSSPIVSLATSSDLPLDSSIPMTVERTIGSYLPSTGETMSLSSLPSKLEKSGIVWHRMIQGSVYNFGSNSLASNTTLAAVGVYAESHWYWKHDECAFLYYANSDVKNCSHSFIDSRTDNRVDYDHFYFFNSSFNCILQELYTESGSANELSPINAYRDFVNYVDPQNINDTITEPETRTSPDANSSKAGYLAVIIVPTLTVGLVGIGLAIFFILRAKKKNNK